VTACAYIHPEGLPTVISDLVISSHAKAKTERPQITPTNIFIESASQNRVELTRKTLVLGKLPLILAFAGDVHGIKRFLGDLKPELNSLNAERPMQRIGEFANGFIDQNRVGLSVIGFCPGERGFNVQSGFENLYFETKNLNGSVVSGSGARWLKTQILEADRNLQNSDWQSSALASIHHARLVGIVGMINSKSIFQTQTLKGDNSFGGYFESTTLAPDGNILKRQSWAHVGYDVVISQGSVNVHLIAKQVSYFPEERVVCARLIHEQGIICAPWQIKSLHSDFDPPTAMPDKPPDVLPEKVTIFLNFPHARKAVHRTLTSSERNEVAKTLGGGVFIDQRFVTELAEKAIRAF
jgi:hypothetical protein